MNELVTGYLFGFLSPFAIVGLYVLLKEFNKKRKEGSK